MCRLRLSEIETMQTHFWVNKTQCLRRRSLYRQMVSEIRYVHVSTPSDGRALSIQSRQIVNIFCYVSAYVLLCMYISKNVNYLTDFFCRRPGESNVRQMVTKHKHNGRC